MDSSLWLVSKTEIGRFLGIDFTLSKNSDWLDQAIPFMTGWLEGVCQRQFIQREQTFEYVAEGDEDLLVLEQFPAASVASFTTSGGGTFVLDSEYRLNSKKGIISLITNLTENVKYTIVYTAGYTAANLPDELKYACSRMIAMQWKKWKDATWDTMGKTSIDGSVTFSVNVIPREVQEIIALYRRV